MMRWIVLLCWLIFFVSCKNNTTYAPSVLSPKGVYSGDDGTSFQLIPYSADGMVQHAILPDAEGNRLSEGLLYRGLKEGAWVTYDYKFNRDMIASVINYKDGVLHGPYFTLEGGQLTTKGNHYEGERDGIVRIYERGTLLEEHTYQKGILNGMSMKFYADGKVKEEGNFVNGERDGLHQWYDQEGNVIIKYTYKNGVKVE